MMFGRYIKLKMSISSSYTMSKSIKQYTNDTEHIKKMEEGTVCH